MAIHQNKVMALTAKQILELDEIGLDKQAIKDTLGVAMTYHSNRMVEITKHEMEFWQELARVHGLDLSKDRFKTDKVDGIIQIIQLHDD